jgi:hypothetical protein
MSDSRRWNSNDSENMREKITKNYLRQGAASKMFREISANSMSSHANISLWPKTVGSCKHSQKWTSKKFTQEVNLPILKNSTGLKLEFALVSRNIFVIFLPTFSESALLS